MRPIRIGRESRVWESDGGAARAFVFTPATGVVDIHPEGFKASFATDMSDKGAAVGVLKPGTKFTEVFVHTDTAGLEIVATGDDFEELASGRKGRFNGVRPERINNQGEIVGCVYMRKGPDFPFYYSDRHGLVDLGAAVEAADPAVEAKDCSPHLNNKSQILLGVKEGSRITGAILRVDG